MTTALTGPAQLEAEAELGWQEAGLCAQVDPDAFFAEKGGSTKEAKRVCLGCEVRERCLQYALDHDERFGVWGGMTERQRRKLKRSLPPVEIPKPRRSPETPKVHRVTAFERQMQILAYLDSCGGEIIGNASVIGRVLKLGVPSAAGTIMHAMVAAGNIEWQPRGRHAVTIRLLPSGVAQLKLAA